MVADKKKVGVGFGVMLFKDGKILLGQRHFDPNKADSELHGEGTWTMPGGKLEYGESFEEGAKREVYEETGLQLDEAKVICINNDKNEYAHFVTIGLFAEDFEGEAKVMEPDEIVRWQWFTLDALPSPMYFPSANILKNYQEKLFYISNHTRGV
ncbi:MAG: nucleotide triphosphate diphosphatase NUDT15 [Patescibacteria group bacterium]|jgi:8-oxo-dGTP diphosphatase